MSTQSINHPSQQAIKQFQRRHQLIRDRYTEDQKRQIYKNFIVTGAWASGIFASLSWLANPIGINRRLQYEKTLSPVMKYTRRYLPLTIVMSGIVYLDYSTGLF